MAGRSITKKIGALEFSVLSPNEIRKMSATKVITADTYDDDGFPITMGLMDQRLSPGAMRTPGGRKPALPANPQRGPRGPRGRGEHAG